METKERRVARELGIKVDEVARVVNSSMINHVENLQKKVNDTILQEVSLLDFFQDAKEIFKMYFDNKEVHPKIFEVCLTLMTTVDDAEALLALRIDRLEADLVNSRLIAIADNLEKAIEAFCKTKPQSMNEEMAINVMFNFVVDIETMTMVFKTVKNRFHAGDRLENLAKVFNRCTPFLHTFAEAKQICEINRTVIDDSIFSLLFSLAKTIDDFEEMHQSFSFIETQSRELEGKIKKLVAKEMKPLAEFDLAFKKAEEILEIENNRHTALRVEVLSYLVPLVVNLKQAKQVDDLASASSDVWLPIRGQYGLIGKYLAFATDPSDFDDVFSFGLNDIVASVIREKAALLAASELDKLNTFVKARKLHSKKDSTVWQFLIINKMIELISTAEEADEMNLMFFQSRYDPSQKEALCIKWLSVVKTLEQVQAISCRGISDELTLISLIKKENYLAMEIINSTDDPVVLKNTFNSIFDDNIPAKAAGIKKWLQITSDREELDEFLCLNHNSEFASQVLKKLISTETSLSGFATLALRHMSQEDRDILLSAWNNFAQTKILPQLDTPEQLKEAFSNFPPKGSARDEAIRKMYSLMEVK